MSGAKNEAVNEQFRNHMWPISLLFHDKLIRSTVLDYFCTCNCVKKQQQKTTREAAKKKKMLLTKSKIWQNQWGIHRNTRKHQRHGKRKKRKKKKKEQWVNPEFLADEKNSFRRSSTSNKADKGEHSEDARQKLNFFCRHINPKRPLEGVLHEVHFHWPTNHEEESPKGKQKFKKNAKKKQIHEWNLPHIRENWDNFSHINCSLAPQRWTK